MLANVIKLWLDIAVYAVITELVHCLYDSSLPSLLLDFSKYYYPVIVISGFGMTWKFISMWLSLYAE